MEWIDGVKLTDQPAMAQYGLDIIDFVDVGIECSLRQLLEHGFFHADPHPVSCVCEGCLRDAVGIWQLHCDSLSHDHRWPSMWQAAVASFSSAVAVLLLPSPTSELFRALRQSSPSEEL